MRVWMDDGKCFFRDDDGRVSRVIPELITATLDGQTNPPIFEADDKEGWALVALGEPFKFGWWFIPDENEPHSCKTEVRRGKVVIEVPVDARYPA